MTINPFVFHSPTRVIFAEGLASTAADIVNDETLGKPGKVFIVTDAVLLQTGLLKPILEGFQKDSYTLFSDVPSDSDVDTVNHAAKLARETGCVRLLAIGGGSVLDTAKVVNICLSYGGELMEYQGLNNLTQRLNPMVAIPTTAGTGSEVSMVAMVKDNAEHKKLCFGSKFLAPDAALLDPTMLVSLPPKLTAATGLDAVTHAIEAYSSLIASSVFTDALCLQSLKIMFEFLPLATKDGADLEARAQTLIASTMAGVAFTNSGVGIVHALAHATGARFGTHHGCTNSIFLPHGMEFNLDVVSGRYAEIARYLKLSESKDDVTAARALIKAVSELSASVGLPSRLRDIGVPEFANEALDELALLAACDPAIMFNPKESTNEDLIALYERAF